MRSSPPKNPLLCCGTRSCAHSAAANSLRFYVMKKTADFSAVFSKGVKIYVKAKGSDKALFALLSSLYITYRKSQHIYATFCYFNIIYLNYAYFMCNINKKRTRILLCKILPIAGFSVVVIPSVFQGMQPPPERALYPFRRADRYPHSP